MWRQANPVRRDIYRKAVTLALLVCLLPSILPIPLPVVRLVKDLSEPFPCQNCACGCVNAEQCWTNCCCFTEVERLQWAKDHGVKPPDYFKFSSATLVAVKQTKPVAVKSCCASHPVAKSEATACCERKNRNCTIAPSQSTKDTELVLVYESLNCRGNTTDYSPLHSAIVVCPDKLLILGERLTSKLSLLVEAIVSPTLSVDVPPPRTC